MSHEAKVKKLYILDLERPDHNLIYKSMEKLNKGLQTELVTNLLKDFFSNQQHDPNKLVKNYLSSLERVSVLKTVEKGK